jgi:plasmid maintenance system antidote protein VapI
MKKEISLDKLHVGSMIKEIVQRKGIPPKELADLILRYQENAAKIYQVNDMECDEMVKISYTTSYNFLKVISEKYLSHLPAIENDSYPYYMEYEPQTGHFKIVGDLNSKDALQNIHVGQHIRTFADKNGWDEQNMAKLLQCSQSTVSDLYSRKTLKVKKLLQISNDLGHNFIAEVYLSRMFIISSPDKESRVAITKTAQEVRIENPDDNNFLVIFYRKHDEKTPPKQ